MKKYALSLSAVFFGIVLIVISRFSFFINLGKYYYIATIIGVIITLIGLCEVVYLFRRRNLTVDNKEIPKYKRKGTYISNAEYNFLNTLRGIDPKKYEVIPQVALNSVIDKVTCNSYRNELFRIVDFLFVDIDTFEPLLLVELNDASHMRKDRMERDAKVAEICALAKMPLITFWPQDQNDFSHIRKLVMKNIIKR